MYVAGGGELQAGPSSLNRSSRADLRRLSVAIDRSVHHHIRYRVPINQTVDYMARGFMIFMRGVDITRGIGRVLLKVEPVLGPEIARA